MLGTSRTEHIFIRICIFLLRYSIPISLTVILTVHLTTGVLTCPSDAHPTAQAATAVLVALVVADTTFALAVYVPFKRRANSLMADHPAEGMTPGERRELFDRVIANVPDPEWYIRTWFLGAELADIRRENLREFIAWAFFDRDVTATATATAPAGSGGMTTTTTTALSDEEEAEMDGYLDVVHKRLLGKAGVGLLPGRGSARAFRLTFDDVNMRFRSVAWYAIVMLVDAYTHASMLWRGFVHRAPSARTTMTVFPPRLHLWPSYCGLVRRESSPSSSLGYWYRPHTARDPRRRPVLFIHGIGIGLVPYMKLLSEVSQPWFEGDGGDGQEDDGETGLIALELLPISMRYAGAPLARAAFLEHITAILSHHGWLGNDDDDHGNNDSNNNSSKEFVLVSHSYGSVLTTHMLRDPSLAPKISAVVLLDPISLLLHLPDTAYNFTRRKPRAANEWQLWFFASTDPGTALALARHFFWRQNAVWKEELLFVRPEQPSGLIGTTTTTGAAAAQKRPRGKSMGMGMGNGSSHGGEEPQQQQQQQQQQQGSDNIDDPTADGGSGNAPAAAHAHAHAHAHGNSNGRPAHGPATGEGEGEGEGEGGFPKRKVAVTLAGRDLIVDAPHVAEYLVCDGEGGGDHSGSGGSLAHPTPEDEAAHREFWGWDWVGHGEYTTASGIEVLYFPALDHAQVLDKDADRRRVVRVVRRYCRA